MRLDRVKREYRLGKGRVWTGYGNSVEWVKCEYALS